MARDAGRAGGKWSDLVPAPAAVFETTFLPDGDAEIPLAARDTFTSQFAQTGSVGLGFIERDGAAHSCVWSLAVRMN